MTSQQFKEKHGVRSCERCCANCRYGRDLCDDGVVECVHPDLEESFYSDLSGVCDAWIEKMDKDKDKEELHG